MGKIHLKYLISVSLLVAADHARSTAYTYVGNFTPSSTQLIGGDTLTLNTSMPSSGGALILDNSGTGTVTVNLAGYNITSDGRPAISFSFQNNLIITGQGTISTSNTGTSLRHDGPNHSIQVRSNITNTNSNYALTLISMTGSSSNSATLSANLSAVLLNTSTTTGTFTNQSSGVISGVTRAVTYGGGASGDFYNYGTIQSTSGDAFFINTTNNVVIYNDGGTVTAASGYAFIDNNSGNSVINLRGGTVIGNINRSGTGTMDIIFGTLDPGNDETDFQGSIETVNSISVAENSTVNFTAGTTPLINRDIAASGSGAKLKFTGSSRTVNMGVRKVNDFSSLFADDGVTVSFDVGEAITTDVGSYNLTLTGNGTFISTVGSLIIQNTSGTFYNSSNIITTFGGATLRNTTGGTNSGTMTATDSASLVWVLDTSTTGVYYNTGTLTSPDAGTYGTVDSRSTSATLNNSGTITCSSTGNAVLLSNNSGIQTLINTGTISSLGNAISGKNAGTKTVNLNGGTITGDISNATGTMNLTFGGSTTTTFAGEFDSVDSVSVAASSTVDFTTATSITSSLDATGSGAGVRFTGSSRTVSMESNTLNDFSSIFVDEGVTLATTNASAIRTDVGTYDLTISGTGTITGTGEGSIAHYVAGTFSNSATIQGSSLSVLLVDTAGGTNSGTITSTGGTNVALYLQAVTGDYLNSGTISTTGTGSDGSLLISGNSTAEFTNTGTISSSTSSAAVSLVNSASTTIFNNTGTISSLGNAILASNSGTKTVNLNGGSVIGNIANSTGTMNLTFGGSTTTTFDGDINGVDTVTVSSGATVIHPNTGIPINYASAGTFTNNAGTIGVSGTTTTALQNNSTGTVAFNLNGGTVYGDIKKNSSGTTNVTFGGSTTTTFDGDINGVDTVTVSSGATVIHPNTGIPINYASAGTFTNSAGTIGVSGTTTTALQNNSTGTVAFNLNGGTIYGDIKKNSSGTTNVTFGGSTTTTFAGEFDSVDSVSVAASSTVDFTTATSITTAIDVDGSEAAVRFTGSSRTINFTQSVAIRDMTSVFIDEGITLDFDQQYGIVDPVLTQALIISGAGNISGTTNVVFKQNEANFSNSVNITGDSNVVVVETGITNSNSGNITSTGTSASALNIIAGANVAGDFINTGTITAHNGTSNGALVVGNRFCNFTNSGTISSTNDNPAAYLSHLSLTTIFTNTGTISSSGAAISGVNGGTKTVNLNGGSIIGDITNATGTMNLTFGNSATTVFSGAMTGVNTLTVSSGATAKFTNSTAAHTISGSTVSIPGTLDFTATTSGTTTQLPSITATSANPDFSGSLAIRSSVYLYPGTFTIINGNVSGTAPASTTSPTNPYVTLSSTESSGDIVLTMTRLGFNAFAKTEAGKDIGRLLESIAYNSPNSTYQQLLNQLDTNLGINENLLQLIPDTSPSLSAVNIQNSGIQKVLLRLSELRKHTDGYYAGTPVAVPKAWLKIIGNTSSQNTTDKIAGYNARTAGAVIGYDQEVENVFSVGAAAAYSLTNTKQKANSNSRTDTKTAQLMIYGSHYYDHFVVDYFDWVLSAGYNSYNGQRAINIGSFNSVAQSEYSGRQYSAKGAWGLNYEPFRYVTASPEASLHYSYLRQKSYRETGNSGVNLTVDSMNTRSLEFAIGGKITVHNYDTNSIYKELELSAKFYHQSINGFGNASRGTQRADVSLEGATGTFIVSNEPSRRGLRLGVASTLVATDRVDLKISYDLDIRGGYRGHTGGLEFRYWF